MKTRRIIICIICAVLFFGSIFSVSVQAEPEHVEQTLTNPPSDTPPSDTIPTDMPPSDILPSDNPPSDTPSDIRPSDNPPSDTPSDTRPSDNPPSDTPSDTRPSDNPPSDTPSDTKPTDTPSDTNPSDEPSDNSQGASIGGINIPVSINGSQAIIGNIATDLIDKAALFGPDTGRCIVDIFSLGHDINGVPIRLDRIRVPMQVGEDILNVLLSNTNNKDTVEFMMPGKSISLNAKGLNAVVGQAKDADTISLEIKDIEKSNLNTAQQNAINQISNDNESNIASLIDVNILADETPIHDLKGGTATIEMDLNRVSGGREKTLGGYYIDSNGRFESITTNIIVSVSDLRASMTTGHCSTYAFIYEEKQANDVNTNTANTDAPRSPKTGDDSNPYALMILLISSLGALMVVGRKIKE